MEVDVFFFPFIGNVEGGGGKGVNLGALGPIEGILIHLIGGKNLYLHPFPKRM